MAVLRGHLILLSLLLVRSQYCEAGDNGKYLVGEDHVYRLKYPGNKSVCMTVSFDVQFNIYYQFHNRSNATNPTINITSLAVKLPNNTAVEVTGACQETNRTIMLSWQQNGTNFSVTLQFELSSQWFLTQMFLGFDLDANTFDSPKDPGFRSYATSSAANKYFNRTFDSSDYYYCSTTTVLWFERNITNNSGPCFMAPPLNTSLCSNVQLSNSVIFPGDLDNNTNVNRKLCIGDYIELQELIVPIVVGGILALLLLLIFTAYIFAFIRRKRREGQYETLTNGYN